MSSLLKLFTLDEKDLNYTHEKWEGICAAAPSYLLKVHPENK